MRRLLNILCVACFCLSVGFAALSVHSRRRGGSLYEVRGGAALAAHWAPGELSLWAGRVDGRCRVNGALDSVEPATAVSARAWFAQDASARAATRGRLGFARCSNFPDFMPARLLRGRVTALVAPFWLLVAATAAPPLARGAGLLRRRVRIRARLRRGECPRCGYDLRASGWRCPECGDESNAPAQRARRGSWGGRRWASVGAAAVIAAVSLVVMNRPPARPAVVAPREGSASWWLGRAVAEARDMSRAGDRCDAYRAILRGYWLLGERAGAAEVVGLLEAELKINADSKSHLPDTLRGELARGYARLGQERRFWRHALPAERAMEQGGAWMLWLARPLSTGYALRGDYGSVAALACHHAQSKHRVRLIDELSNDVGGRDRKAFLNGVRLILKREADRASYWGDRSYALYYLAQLQIRTGDLAGARQTAEQILGLGYRANLLDDLATAYANAGDGAAARAARELAAAVRPPSSPQPDRQAVDATEQVRDHFRNGQRDAGIAGVGAAELAIGRESDLQRREWATMYLAQVLAEAGELGECRRVLAGAGHFPTSRDDVKPPLKWWADPSLRTLASAIALNGDAAWAERLVEMTRETMWPAGYASIAGALARRGEIEAAKAYSTRRVASVSLRQQVVRGIARAQAEQRGVSGLLEWAEGLATPEERAFALIGAAEGVSGKSFGEPVP